MTTHEAARLILAGPDVELSDGLSFDEVNGNREARLEQALRDINERLTKGTKPIFDVLQDHGKAPAVVHAWKWAVYGSAIHAQLAYWKPKTD